MLQDQSAQVIGLMAGNTVHNQALARHLSRLAQLIANIKSLRVQLQEEMDQITDLILADYQEQFKEPAGVQLLQAMGYNLDLFQMTLDRFQEVLCSFSADLDEQAISLV